MKQTQKKSEKVTTTIGLRPLMGYVLVEPSDAQTTTASGIILPESAQEKPAQGRVVAIGQDMFLENGKVMITPVNVGDIVVYKKWGGDEIRAKGRDYKLIRFDDLMAVVEE